MRNTDKLGRAEASSSLVDPTRAVLAPFARPPRVLLGLALLTLAATAALAAENFEGKVVSVHDGDTATVLRDGHDQVKIRVEGIDCPELAQAFGRRAKEFTARLVFGRQVTIKGKERDQYGRLVARVLVDGKDLSHELVKAGLAWHFKRYSNDQALASEEAAARRAKAGLWADPHPMAPWDFRHGGRSPAATRSSDATGTLHGNESSHVYHLPSCPQYNCRRCTRYFKTPDEARAAGFRPAGCCAARAR